MKNNKSYLLGIVGAFVFATVSATSQTNSEPSHNHYRSDLLFRAGEASLDIFGSLSVGQETLDNISSDRVEDDGRLGLGVGANYFFTRRLGLGADAYTENTQHSFVDNTSASLILRFPFDRIRLAPYVYGGGGYQFDPTGLWFAQVGGGLEFRFTKSFGVFTDARYVFTDATQNIGVGRLGIRFSY